MPKLADKQGTKLCVLISVLGTAVAYGVQGALPGVAVFSFSLRGNPKRGRGVAMAKKAAFFGNPERVEGRVPFHFPFRN